MPRAERREVVIPRLEERVTVEKREQTRERTRIAKTVQRGEVEVDGEAVKEDVEVERVPVNRVVVEAPRTRVEGDVTIIAVVEEIVVVEKRFLVKEEVHVRKRRVVVRRKLRVPVRRERVTNFDDYAPAYQYGYDLRRNEQYASKKWEDIEPNARAGWEQRSPGTWERFKAAVKHAWDDVTS